MQRRKFMIGVGSLAAGGAAATGTGAFTSAQANRDVSINVAGDASAYLQIEAEDTPNGNEFVNTPTGSAVSLSFDSVNDQADMKFANLLRVQNEGTQIIRVGVDMDASDLPDGFGVFAEGAGSGDLYPKNDLQPDPTDSPNKSSGYDVDDANGYDGSIDYKAASGHDNPSGPAGGPNGGATGAGFDYPSDPVHLEVGEAVENIGVAWDANDVDFDELDGDHTMVIVAEAINDGQPGQRT